MSQREKVPVVASAGQKAHHEQNRDDWVRMQVTAELLEDAHPGSGSGGGGIDALVARDRCGRPVIWASHVEGVLRDAARLLRGHDAASDFFGRAGGQQQRAVFTSLYTESAPESRIWRSTARAAFDNRAPNDDTLRVIEHVPKGTQFVGQVELPTSDLPLLRRLFREVDALGRGRSTGAGRVRLALAKSKISPRAVGQATDRLVLLLRNRDPLCLTATATPDNLIPSLNFVPGRAVLGSLASWLIAEGHRETATLLVSGRLSVSDALPVPNIPGRLSDAEVLPAPLSLQSEKPAGSKGSVPWWAQPPIPVTRLDGYDCKTIGVKLKRPEGDLFVCRAGVGKPWTTLRPTMRVRLRNGRPDPTQADPSLFAIEQIAEETWFLCEIRGTQVEMQQLADGLQPVIEGCRWLRIGRAGAPVEVSRFEWCKEFEWSKEPTPVEPSPRAVLTLTSDLLVRDEQLRWCTTINAAFKSLSDLPQDIRIVPDSVMQETVAVHGFNGTSRLWRLPAYGVRMGTVFRVEGNGVAELARRAAEGKWLGERTHEGFGRFRLDDALPGVTSGTPGSLTDVADEPADHCARTTRDWLTQHPSLAKPGGSSDRKPSLSQWFDLVAELERNDANALQSRRNPTTAGGRCWRHPDAIAILDNLATVQDRDLRTAHARLFVRWLRAEMRKRAK